MKIVAFVLLLLFSSSSYASHNCIGKVNSVNVDGYGAVLVSVGSLGEGSAVCYLNKPHGEFTADACKAAFSLFLSAKMTGKDVRLYFRNDANPSCSKGSWIDLATDGIYFVSMEN